MSKIKRLKHKRMENEHVILFVAAHLRYQQCLPFRSAAPGCLVLIATNIIISFWHLYLMPNGWSQNNGISIVLSSLSDRNLRVKHSETIELPLARTWSRRVPLIVFAILTVYVCVCACATSLKQTCFTQYLLVSVIAIETAKSNAKNSQYDTKHDSKVPSIRFQNVKPLHSGVDVSASCPRCLAAAAQKPNGGDGECVSTVSFHYSSCGSRPLARSLACSSSFSLSRSRCVARSYSFRSLTHPHSLYVYNNFNNAFCAAAVRL